MLLRDRYDGGDAPLRGERVLLLRSLPANARILKATATVSPVDASTGRDPFAETIRFQGATGDWGATKTATPGWVEVDFHGRQTLARVSGTNLSNATIQVDLGAGAYVEVNPLGAFRAPSDPRFMLAATTPAPLPALIVARFKLTHTGNPDVGAVTIRSVPSNVRLRLGTLPPFWTYTGELTAPQTTPDFADVLQAFLADGTVEHGFYVIPVRVESATIARLVVAVEIDYLLESAALPSGLDEVSMSFDFGGAPREIGGRLNVALPSGARVVASQTRGRAVGAFESSRIAHGPLDVADASVTVAVSPESSQAQPIVLATAVTATAIDLLVSAVTSKARLQVEVRADLNGKPGPTSLLPGRTVVDLDRAIAGRPTWVSVRLPGAFRFGAGHSWLVVQSSEGEAAWSVSAALPNALGMQATRNGGLSWRASGAAGGPGTVDGFFRLRREPPAFEMPIELKVGEDPRASRVALDRFEALGRVELDLGFADIARAFNDYLAGAAPAACPEGEHLLNGEFEEWRRVGQVLMAQTAVPLGLSPAAVAAGPSGAVVYVAGSTQQRGHLQSIDVLSNRATDEDVALSQPDPRALLLSPDGRRAYVIGNQGTVLVVDTLAHRELGAANFGTAARAAALSPDGRRLFILEYSPAKKSAVRAVDTVALERAVTGELTIADASTGASLLAEQHEPVALAVAPDGDALWVVVVKHDAGDTGEVRVFDAENLASAGPAVAVGPTPSAIALTPDGRRVVVANLGDHTLSLLDTTSADGARTVDVGVRAAALAVAPEGGRVYAAGESVTAGQGALAVVDVDTLKILDTMVLQTAPLEMALTPGGDVLYLRDANDNATSAVTSLQSRAISIQVGARVPTEWALTSGSAAPIGLSAPFHIGSLLGTLPRDDAQAATTTSLSQIAPAAPGCPYEFSFFGLSRDSDAVAELFWRGDACNLLRTDPVPIARLEAEPTNPVTPSAREPRLIQHRARLIGPPGTTQVEVRFTVPPPGGAVVTNVSLRATANALENGDLRMARERRPIGWTLTPSGGTAAAVVAGDDAVQVRNGGGDVLDLAQTIDVPTPGASITLELRGRAQAGPGADGAPRLELRWLRRDGTAAAPPDVLPMAEATFERVAATIAAPAEATRAELHLILPPGSTQDVRNLSAQLSKTTVVPATFLAEAPGVLTVSDWRLAYDRVAPPPPAVPATGLCSPTPPHGTDGTSEDGCFCPCCGTERALVGPSVALTRSRRPVVVGRCQSCGAELLRPGGALLAAAPPLSHPILSARLRPAGIGVMPGGLRAIFRPDLALPPLTAIRGLGPARVQRLVESGIDTVQTLAAADPAAVTQALKGAGVSAVNAALFVGKAREIVAAAKVR